MRLSQHTIATLDPSGHHRRVACHGRSGFAIASLYHLHDRPTASAAISHAPRPI